VTSKWRFICVKQVDKLKVKEGISWTQAPAFDLLQQFCWQQ